jgi:hypothetical protein
MLADVQTRYHFLVDMETRQSIERSAAQMRDDCTRPEARATRSETSPQASGCRPGLEAAPTRAH